MKRRNGAMTIALIAMVVGMSGLLAEAVLRVYAGLAGTSLAVALQVDPYAILVEPHGELGFRPRPGRTFNYANGTAAHTNAMGFRGPIVEVPKPAGTYRIVLLGGSTTFGWGVDDAETIDRYMSLMLAERYRDQVVEVVNLAFDGYDSYQLYERFRSDGVALEPDAVIVNSGVNDAGNAWFLDIEDGDRRTLLYQATMEQARFELSRGGPTLWTRVKHLLYLARVPGWLNGRLRRAAAKGAPPRPYHWDALDYFERNLRRLLELSVDAESSLVLFSTPPSSLLTLYARDEPVRASYWIIDAQTTQVYRDSLSARMRSLAVEGDERDWSVDYVPHGELPPSLFLDDAHLTPEGNRRMAEDFVAALEPWISGPASNSP